MFTGAKAIGEYHYETLKAFHIIDLNCSGFEESVLNCSYNQVKEHSCNTNYDDAIVQCSGQYFNLFLIATFR